MLIWCQTQGMVGICRNSRGYIISDFRQPAGY